MVLRVDTRKVWRLFGALAIIFDAVNSGMVTYHNPKVRPPQKPSTNNSPLDWNNNGIASNINKPEAPSISSSLSPPSFSGHNNLPQQVHSLGSQTTLSIPNSLSLSSNGPSISQAPPPPAPPVQFSIHQRPPLTSSPTAQGSSQSQTIVSQNSPGSEPIVVVEGSQSSPSENGGYVESLRPSNSPNSVSSNTVSYIPAPSQQQSNPAPQQTSEQQNSQPPQQQQQQSPTAQQNNQKPQAQQQQQQPPPQQNQQQSLPVLPQQVLSQQILPQQFPHRPPPQFQQNLPPQQTSSQHVSTQQHSHKPPPPQPQQSSQQVSSQTQSHKPPPQNQQNQPPAQEQTQHEQDHLQQEQGSAPPQQHLEQSSPAQQSSHPYPQHEEVTPQQPEAPPSPQLPPSILESQESNPSSPPQATHFISQSQQTSNSVTNHYITDTALHEQQINHQISHQEQNLPSPPQTPPESELPAPLPEEPLAAQTPQAPCVIAAHVPSPSLEEEQQHHQEEVEEEEEDEHFNIEQYLAQANLVLGNNYYYTPSEVESHSEPAPVPAPAPILPAVETELPTSSPLEEPEPTPIQAPSSVSPPVAPISPAELSSPNEDSSTTSDVYAVATSSSATASASGPATIILTTNNQQGTVTATYLQNITEVSSNTAAPPPPSTLGVEDETPTSSLNSNQSSDEAAPEVGPNPDYLFTPISAQNQSQDTPVSGEPEFLTEVPAPSLAPPADTPDSVVVDHEILVQSPPLEVEATPVLIPVPVDISINSEGEQPVSEPAHAPDHNEVSPSLSEPESPETLQNQENYQPYIIVPLPLVPIVPPPTEGEEMSDEEYPPFNVEQYLAQAALLLGAQPAQQAVPAEGNTPDQAQSIPQDPIPSAESASVAPQETNHESNHETISPNQDSLNDPHLSNPPSLLEDIEINFKPQNEIEPEAQIIVTDTLSSNEEMTSSPESSHGESELVLQPSMELNSDVEDSVPESLAEQQQTSVELEQNEEHGGEHDNYHNHETLEDNDAPLNVMSQDNHESHHEDHHEAEENSQVDSQTVENHNEEVATASEAEQAPLVPEVLSESVTSQQVPEHYNHADQSEYSTPTQEHENHPEEVQIPAEVTGDPEPFSYESEHYHPEPAQAPQPYYEQTPEYQYYYYYPSLAPSPSPAQPIESSSSSSDLPPSLEATSSSSDIPITLYEAVPQSDSDEDNENERARPIRPFSVLSGRPSALGLTPMYSYSGGNINQGVFGNDNKLMHGSVSAGASKSQNGTLSLLENSENSNSKNPQNPLVNVMSNTVYNSFLNGPASNPSFPKPGSNQASILMAQMNNKLPNANSPMAPTIVALINPPREPGKLNQNSSETEETEESPSNGNNLNNLYNNYYFPEDSVKNASIWINNGMKHQVVTPFFLPLVFHGNSEESMVHVMESDMHHHIHKEKTGSKNIVELLAKDEYENGKKKIELRPIGLVKRTVPKREKYSAAKDVMLGAGGEKKILKNANSTQYSAKEDDKLNVIGEVKPIFETKPEPEVRPSPELVKPSEKEENKGDEQKVNPIPESKLPPPPPGPSAPEKNESAHENKESAPPPPPQQTVPAPAQPPPPPKETPPSKPETNSAAAPPPPPPPPQKQKDQPPPKQKDSGPTGPQLPQPPAAPSMVEIPSIPDAMSVPTMVEIQIPDPNVNAPMVPTPHEMPDLMGGFVIPSVPKPPGEKVANIAPPIEPIASNSDNGKKGSKGNPTPSAAKPKPNKKPSPNNQGNKNIPPPPPQSPSKVEAPSPVQPPPKGIEIEKEEIDLNNSIEDLEEMEDNSAAEDKVKPEDNQKIEDDSEEEEEEETTVDIPEKSPPKPNMHKEIPEMPYNAEKALSGKPGRPMGSIPSPPTPTGYGGSSSDRNNSPIKECPCNNPNLNENKNPNSNENRNPNLSENKNPNSNENKNPSPPTPSKSPSKVPTSPAPTYSQPAEDVEDVDGDMPSSSRPLRPLKPKRPARPHMGSKKPKPRPGEKANEKFKENEVDESEPVPERDPNVQVVEITFIVNRNKTRPTHMVNLTSDSLPPQKNSSSVFSSPPSSPSATSSPPKSPSVSQPPPSSSSTTQESPAKQPSELLTMVPIPLLGWDIPVINWSYFTDYFYSFFGKNFRTSSGVFTCDEMDDLEPDLRTELEVDYLCGDDVDFSRADGITTLMADSHVCNLFCTSNGFHSGLCMPQKNCMCYITEEKNFAIKLERLADYPVMNSTSTVNANLKENNAVPSLAPELAEPLEDNSEASCQNCRCLKACQNREKYVGYCSKSCHCGVPWYSEYPSKTEPNGIGKL